MRAISFRYRLEYELVNKEKGVLDHGFKFLILSLKEIEGNPPKRQYRTQDGIFTIIGIAARDQFTEYIDEACIDLFENDKCMDGEKIGYITMKSGQWVWELEDGTEIISLEKCYWHIRKIGTRWGDESLGEVRKYDTKGLEEIIE